MREQMRNDQNRNAMDNGSGHLAGRFGCVDLLFLLYNTRLKKTNAKKL